VRPLAGSRLSKPVKIILVEFGYLLVLLWSLSHEGSSPKDIVVLGHTGLGAESVDIGQELLLGNTVKRIDGLFGAADVRAGALVEVLGRINVFFVVGLGLHIVR